MTLITDDIMYKTFNIHSTASSVSIDSRKIEKDGIFFCFKGLNVDGHDFAKNAIENGAKFVVTEKELNLPNQYIIRVANTEESFITLTKNIRNKLTSTVIGITGSAGKTSTKMQMKIALSNQNVIATEGNYNTVYGIGLTICNLKEIPKYLVLELGISKPGEMEILASIAQPDYSIITNIGPAHTEYLKNVETVAKEKGILLKYTKKHAFLPKICKKHCPITLQHNITNNESYLDNIKPILEIARMENIQNIDISSYVPEKGRNNIVELSKDDISFRIIDGSYNCNPISLKSSINQLKEYSGRKIVILGEMKELGEYSKEAHTVDFDVDILLLLGSAWNSKNGIIFKNYTDICKYLEEIIQNGDIILLKGSNSTDIKLIVRELENKYTKT